MGRDGIDVSVCAAALRTIKDPSMEGHYHRIMVYFLVSCFCDWICEQQPGGQSVELRQFHTNQDSARSERSVKEHSGNTRIRLNQCILSDKRGCKTSAQGLTICLESHEGTKNSLGLGYNIFSGAACHYGYDFRLKHCASNGGANLNAADTTAARTGLNLHFIPVILFLTNKLTPEKT